MRLTKKVKITSMIATLIILINGYLLLKENDIILKKYALHNVQYAVADDYQKLLETDVIVTSKYEHFIAAPVQSISEVLVTQGQSINAMSELAIYKPEEVEREITRLQTDRDAYTNELAQLEAIVSDLQREGGNSTPRSSTDSTSLGDNENWNVNLTLELGIEQNTPTAEGIAIVQRSIAETERLLTILDSMISQLSNHHALVSPVDGMIKEIILAGDSITFQIQSMEKKAVLYVTHKTWQEIEAGQTASITLFEGTDDEQAIDGTVLEKQQIPARDSIAYEEMTKHEKVAPTDTIYEVSIEPVDSLLATPIGTFAQAKITTAEATNSFQVRENWLVQYEHDSENVTPVNEKFVYIVGKDGKTQLAPVDVLFKHKAAIKQIDFMYERSTPDEAPVEEVEIPIAPRIQTVQLEKQDEENITEEDNLEDAVVFTAPIDPYQIFIEGDEKNLSAPTFSPYPLRTFEWAYVDVTWKDVVWYLMK